MVEFENAIEESEKDHKFVQWCKRRKEDLKEGGGI
jgi:hypothetical protein